MARVVLELNNNGIENLDKLKERMGIKTRTELIRHALALLDIAQEKQKDGYRLQFKKGDSITEVAHLF